MAQRSRSESAGVSEHFISELSFYAARKDRLEQGELDEYLCSAKERAL